MVISENVMIGETIAHQAASILASIRKGERQPALFWYAVTTAREAENVLYVLSSVEMRHAFYQSDAFRLLGLAGSKKEAGEIVRKLVQGCADCGQLDRMKAYMEEY